MTLAIIGVDMLNVLNLESDVFFGLVRSISAKVLGSFVYTIFSQEPTMVNAAYTLQWGAHEPAGLATQNHVASRKAGTSNCKATGMCHAALVFIELVPQGTSDATREPRRIMS